MARGEKQQDWPIETLVVVMRNALREEDQLWGKTKGTRASAILERLGPDPATFDPGLFQLVPLYPFTKGLDLTNDGLGYGEQTEVTLRFEDGGLAVKCSRRTRTGSARLRFEDPSGAPLGRKKPPPAEPPRAREQRPPSEPPAPHPSAPASRPPPHETILPPAAESDLKFGTPGSGKK